MSFCLVLSARRFSNILNLLCTSTHRGSRAISIEEKGRAEENVYFLKQQQQQLLLLRKKLMAKERQIIEALIAIDKKMREMVALEKIYTDDKDKVSLQLVQGEIERLKAQKKETVKNLSTFQSSQSKESSWLEAFKQLEKKIVQKESELKKSEEKTEEPPPTP